MAKKPEWVKFYPAEWLLDPNVMAMSWAQRGLFMHCLCIQAREGSLPGNQDEIRRMVGIAPAEWRRLWTPILENRFGVTADGTRINRRMADSTEAWKRMADGGRLGGNITELPTRVHQAPLAGLGKPPSDNQEAEAEAEEKQNTSGDTSPPRRRHPFWWDLEKGKLDGTREAKKQLVADWVRPDRLTKQEFEMELLEVQNWLVDRPHRRSSRSDLKRFIYNWLKRKIADKQGTATARARLDQRRAAIESPGRAQPAPWKPNWCPECREQPPGHSEKCSKRDGT